MDVSISDSALTGFNDQAKAKLIEATSEFAGDLVAEANRIESARNTTGGHPEITSSMVHDAKVLLRRGLVQPRKGVGIRIFRIVAAVLSLLVGILYDSTKLQDSTYMLIFIGVVTAAILTVTIATIKE